MRPSSETCSDTQVSSRCAEPPCNGDAENRRRCIPLGSQLSFSSAAENPADDWPFFLILRNARDWRWGSEAMNHGFPVIAIVVIVVTGCDSSRDPGSSMNRPQPSNMDAISANADPDVGKSDSAAVAPTDTLRADDWFEDVTERTGVRFVHRNGRESKRFYLIESFGGGAAQVDYDLDGLADLFLTGGGKISAAAQPTSISGLPPGLFRNRGQWQFAESTEAAALTGTTDYSLGCTVTDFDSDGFADVFVFCYGRSRLYRNQGDGAFSEATSDDQLPATGMSTAAAWADVDADGHPDLFLARYVDWSPETDVVCYSGLKVRDLCGPGQYDESTAQLWHNRGDGHFDDWSLKVGLKGGVKGLGIVIGDFNGDGRLDVYLANDETANHLYWGSAETVFREAGWESGVAAGEAGLEEGSMGTDIGDIDGDGRPDLWVVNFENEDNSLYRNMGNDLFRHVTVPFRLAGVSRMSVGWGTALTDFDSDGWLDILVLNSNALYHSPHSPFEQRPQLFRNISGQRFSDMSHTGGSYFRHPHAARGAAVGDLDKDGALDIVASHLNEPVRILRNRNAPVNWFRIGLVGLTSARQPVGAQITLKAEGSRELTRFIVSGAGYASHSDQRIVFPLPEATAAASVTVRWPGGLQETFSDLAARQDHVLIKGRGITNEPQ